MGARGGRPPSPKRRGKMWGQQGKGHPGKQTSAGLLRLALLCVQIRLIPTKPSRSVPNHSEGAGWAPFIYLLPFRVPAVELLRFSLALNNGVSCLQVRGVCHEGQGDVPVGDAVDPPVVHPQVVLHVTRALGEGEESHCHATGAARGWGRVALTPGAAKRGLLAARNHLCCPPAAGSWQKAAGFRSWPGTHHSSSLM